MLSAVAHAATALPRAVGHALSGRPFDTSTCARDALPPCVRYSETGKPIGTWCPSPLGKLLYSRISSPSDLITFPVRAQGGNLQVLVNVNAKAQFESKYWRGVLDAQGKVDGGYY